MAVSFAKSEIAPIVERIVRAEKNFDEQLMEIAGIDAETAAKVRRFYIKKKLAKVDAGIGRISVTHGGFLAADVILRAVEMA